LRLIDTQGEITLNIVSTGVGAISENDIYMASGSKTVIYGFNVTVPNAIAKLAERNGVPVRVFRVIYELLDDAKSSMENLLDAEVVEEEVGEMKIKGVFRTEKSSIIAGGEVLTGKASAKIASPTGAGVDLPVFGRVYRNKELVGEVEVDSVQKEKMAVNELVAGETGGIAFKLNHKLVIELDDRVKFFTREMRKKKL
jgi:translation initiation factor IF-2